MPMIELPDSNRKIAVATGANLLHALIESGIYPDAPCGGNGKCGKCKVVVNGAEVLACQTVVDRNMTVILPQQSSLCILHESIGFGQSIAPLQEGYLLSFDIGTTSVVCFLLDGKTGALLAQSSMQNPQTSFGADVITRIQAALQGGLEQLTALIRNGMTELIQAVCDKAGILPKQIGVISVVGNPAMQQLFLGISPENLAQVPFAPVLTEAQTVSCHEILPICSLAQLLIIPDIGGYVGADTVGCLLSTKLYEKEAPTLLVDIGTNGEMVLGNKDRMIACATAAGPALEGANIQFGMRAAVGAIDHVWLEKGKVAYSVIGGETARGICGSGLIDAIAAGLKLGLINKRGKLLTNDRVLRLTEEIYLTQEDIRQVQLAKGAICAGITLLTEQFGIELCDIHKVQLAGAFGSFLNPENACRIGLLPAQLLEKIEVVGNAALSGATMLALDKTLLPFTQNLTGKTEFLELASLPSFPKTFAKAMLFQEEDPISRWLEKSKEIGFDVAVTLDPRTLTAREDVRAMCAEDKCGAYNKNWTCPPAVGALEECQQQMRQYKRGILLQTVGHLRKTVDSKGYRETEQRHMQNFYTLAEAIRREYPDALCLGAGGCRVCKQCSYPDPCRFPEKAVSSMEGYGLFVTQVCRDTGVPYHYGDRTITYTACILF